MRNRPKYSFFKNFSYALDGVFEVFKSETAFKIEVFFFVILTLFLLILSIPLWAKFLLFGSMFFVFVAEFFNSSVERVVDLVTLEKHPLAKGAKDAAAAGVLFSIFFTLCVWIGIFSYLFEKGYF